MSKKMMILLFAVIICLSLAGCSLQDKIGDYSREQCYLNKENVTQFSYKGNDYTILADTVSNSGLGEWIGYIQQLAAVDESGKILLQENLKTATFQTLADLADLVDKAPNDAYIIPFLNVYAAPNADDYLIVDINGGYHKAVIDENIKGTDTVFDFKDIEQSMSGKFEINPQNATQLLCDGTVYQVTSDFDTFSKSDFRAVKVKECEAVKKSKKLLKFVLDDGTGVDRVILSGIHEYYEPEELVGKTCIAITNLPPRPMMVIDSCGMLISAVHHENGEEKLHLLMVDPHIPAGAKLY